MLKKAGYVLLTDPGADCPDFEADTLQCVHCGGHFVVNPGSGKIRGMCTRCAGPICGPGCKECVPVETYLEIMEGTRNPTAVTVAGKLWLS